MISATLVPSDHSMGSPMSLIGSTAPFAEDGQKRRSPRSSVSRPTEYSILPPWLEGCYKALLIGAVSDHRQKQNLWCIRGFWALGLGYFLPEWLKMDHNKEHRCSSCGERVAIILHDQQVGNANYVPSAFATESQPPQQKNMVYKGPAISSI